MAMRAAATTVARAAAVLSIAFLSLRGAIGLWQQFAAAPGQPATSATTPHAAQQPITHLRAALPREPPVASGPSQPAAGPWPVSHAPVSWRAIETSASFVEGHAGPIVAAFIDLDCGYCSQLWRRVRAPLAAGRLRVRWIPVAVLAPDGAARAAALLHAADPVAALAAHESRAASPLQVPLQSLAAAAISDDIAANNALLATLTDGRPATPLLVALGRADRLQMVTGLPADLAPFLADAR